MKKIIFILTLAILLIPLFNPVKGENETIDNTLTVDYNINKLKLLFIPTQNIIRILGFQILVLVSIGAKIYQDIPMDP